MYVCMYVCMNETLRKYVAYCGLSAESNHHIKYKIMNNEWFSELALWRIQHAF